jgi:pimeloyl-ACP methyl ester carboxylesterase
MEAMAGPCGYFASPFPDQIEIHTSTPVFNWIYVPATGERKVTLYHIHLSKFPSEGMPPDIYCCFPECSMRGIDVYSSSYALPYSERLLESGKYWWVVWARHDPTDPNDWECVSPIYWFTVTAPEVSFLDKEDLRREVVGAAADGASKVVIQIAGLPEDTTSDDVQISLPNGDEDGYLQDDKQLVDRVFTQTYVVPSCFVRNGHLEDLTAQEREIDLSIIVKGEQIDHEPFTLVRPPVVLLHGLWAADPPIWTGLKAYLKSNGFNVVNDDPYPDDYSFEQNHYVVHAHVDRALAEARQQGLVAKKADVVGHSMGGILIEKYGDISYIRRAVTIGTPHFGSPWANWLLGNPWLELVLNWYGGKSMNHGAISDLQTNVCNVPGGTLKVPVLAIAGSSSPDTFPGSGGDVFSAIFSLATLGLGTPSQVHTARFGNDTSDWVVSVPSQAGGLPIEKIPGIWHLEEPGNSTVFSKVADFLNATNVAAGAAIVQSLQPQMEINRSAIASYPSQVHAQLTEEGGGEITITAPLAGSTYSPGDTVHVNVVVPPGTTKVWVGIPGGAAVISETPPFAIDITIPQEAFGQSRIIAVAWGEQGFLAITSTIVNVTTPATIIALKVWPDSGLYLVAGETVPFVVHGVFSDGVERDITTSQCGTVYNTTDSLVASIDINGILTAKAPGYCSVIVSNCVSMQIPVLVQASAIIGDFNGDGKVDFADFAIIAGAWLSNTGNPEWNPACDISNPKDGIVNVMDIAVFCENWLQDVAFGDRFVGTRAMTLYGDDNISDGVTIDSSEVTAVTSKSNNTNYTVKILDTTFSMTRDGNDLLVLNPQPQDMGTWIEANVYMLSDGFNEAFLMMGKDPNPLDISIRVATWAPEIEVSGSQLAGQWLMKWIFDDNLRDSYLSVFSVEYEMLTITDLGNGQVNVQSGANNYVMSINGNKLEPVDPIPNVVYFSMVTDGQGIAVTLIGVEPYDPTDVSARIGLASRVP